MYIITIKTIKDLKFACEKFIPENFENDYEYYLNNFLDTFWKNFSRNIPYAMILTNEQYKQYKKEVMR